MALGAVLLGGCGAAERQETGPVPTPTVSATPAASTATADAPATTTEPERPTAAPTPGQAQQQTWVMPNLVGRTLQQAQDAVQELTGFGITFTSSTDATGQGRAQVLDRNWVVCGQNVAPGTAITTSTSIEFAAVKLDERCP